MTDAPLCPETGTEMVRDVRPFPISYKGRNATIDMPGWYSTASDECIFTREDLRISDRALTSLKADVHHLVGPDEVRAIRERLGLSQVEASRIFGGGPRSFQKYESGEVLTSRSMTNLLRMAARHPEDLPQMRAEAAEAAEAEQELA